MEEICGGIVEEIAGFNAGTPPPCRSEPHSGTRFAHWLTLGFCSLQYDNRFVRVRPGQGKAQENVFEMVAEVRVEEARSPA